MTVHANVSPQGTYLVVSQTGQFIGPYDTRALITALEHARIRSEASGKTVMFELAPVGSVTPGSDDQTRSQNALDVCGLQEANGEQAPTTPSAA